MTVNRLVLEWEERIRLHQENEMEFNQWRSNNFKDERPDLIEEEEGVEDEGEVTLECVTSSLATRLVNKDKRFLGGNPICLFRILGVLYLMRRSLEVLRKLH
ncbi:hypothetical protein Tco_0307306 [Tanacetum coccineum]